VTPVLLKLFLGPFSFHRGITLCLCKVERHGLAEQLESIHFVNGVLRALDTVEDDERLSPALQTALRNDIDDVAVFGEDFA